MRARAAGTMAAGCRLPMVIWGTRAALNSKERNELWQLPWAFPGEVRFLLQVARRLGAEEGREIWCGQQPVFRHYLLLLQLNRDIDEDD